MKKIVTIIFLIIIIPSIKALDMCENDSFYNGDFIYVNSIKETTKNDSYDTIERNSTIIGNTKFTSDEVITALKATKAGSNHASTYLTQNNSSSGYTDPTIYIYYGEIGGWYSLNRDNVSTYITNTSVINKLSEQNIYFVNNKEKVVFVDYDSNLLKCLNSNMKLKDNKLYARVNSKTLNLRKKNDTFDKFIFNESTGNFIPSN